MFDFKLINRSICWLVIVAVSTFSIGCGETVSIDCELQSEPPRFSFAENENVELPAANVGRTFYISNSGDDEASGATTQTAWRTISKINRSRFQPGDRILFRRGDVWREQLNIPSGGASGLPVVFGAYPTEGSGAPSISGAETVSDWKLFSPGIYRARFDAEPANVYIDDQQTPLARCGSLADVEKTENSWFYDQPEKLLYVRLPNRAAPALHRIEAAVRDYNIYASGKSGVKIENLELKHARRSAILAEGDGSDFWTIANCTIRNATEAAVYARPFDRAGAPFLRGWTVENNRIGRIDGGSNLDYDRAGILLRHVKDAVVRNNTVATGTKMGITLRDYFKAGGSEGGLVAGNKLTDNQGNISIWMTTGSVVRENVIFRSKGYGIGVGVRSHNALIVYNSINFLRESEDGTLFNGIDVNADSQNGAVFHNTVLNVRGFNLTLEQSDRACNGWRIKNNIFDARQAPFHRHSNIAVDPLVDSFTFASNIYVPSRRLPNIVNHFHRRDMTMAEWTAAANDKNSFAADPLFVDADNNDLRLSSGSPARGKAEPLPGINDYKPLNLGAY